MLSDDFLAIDMYFLKIVTKGKCVAALYLKILDVSGCLTYVATLTLDNFQLS